MPTEEPNDLRAEAMRMIETEDWEPTAIVALRELVRRNTLGHEPIRGSRWSPPRPSVDDAVRYLNELLALDPAGVSALFEMRIPVGEGIASDRTSAQVSVTDGEFSLGVLGVLNGIFGTREDGTGHIITIVDSLGNGLDSTNRMTVRRFAVAEPWKVVSLTPDELAAARKESMARVIHVHTVETASAIADKPREPYPFPIGSRVLWKASPMNGMGHRTDVGIVTSYATSTIARVRFSGSGFPGKSAPEYPDQTFDLHITRLMKAPDAAEEDERSRARIAAARKELRTPLGVALEDSTPRPDGLHEVRVSAGARDPSPPPFIEPEIAALIARTRAPLLRVYLSEDDGTADVATDVLAERVAEYFKRVSTELSRVTAARTTGPAPVPMILFCSKCGARHIDEGDFTTKPHHTHACQECGFVWRPAIVPTVGVRFLPGFRNERLA